MLAEMEEKSKPDCLQFSWQSRRPDRRGTFGRVRGDSLGKALDLERVGVEPGFAHRVFKDALDLHVGNGLTKFEVMGDGGPIVIAHEPALHGIGHHGNDAADLRISCRL